MAWEPDKRAPQGRATGITDHRSSRRGRPKEVIPAALGGRDGDPVLWGGPAEYHRLGRPPLRLRSPNKENTRGVDFFPKPRRRPARPIRDRGAARPGGRSLEVLVEKLGDRFVFGLPLKPHENNEEHEADQRGYGEENEVIKYVFEANPEFLSDMP